MRSNLRSRSEEGSVALTAMVSVITLSLTAALLTTVYRDIRVSRRAGDAANALQVADAGLNDAVKSLRNAVAVPNGCPGTAAPAFSRTSTLAGGTYTYCAFPDTDTSGRPVWHIDATATDATGVKRRLRAEAVAEPMFPNAINVIASGTFSSGFSVDSFKDEVTRCTGKGKVGTNSPSQFTFGNNGNNSSENCQNNPNGNFPHPPDGCVAYSRNGDVPIPNSSIGSGQCPPTNTTMLSPEFPRPSIDTRFLVPDFPTTGAPGGNFTCDAAGELVAGKTYYYNSVTLGENCSFAGSGPWPTSAAPTRIFAGTLTVAGGTGNSLNPINQPPNSATVCGSTHTMAGADPMYCPGWAGALQVYVTGDRVDFTGNHSTFWGVITAPNAAVRWLGGAAQWEIFGSLTANSIAGAVQAEWHYDENLGSLTSGRYFPRNWREEPLK